MPRNRCASEERTLAPGRRDEPARLHPGTEFDAPARHRTAFTPGIQFLANQNIAPGLMTADGKVWITADSKPTDAINNAIASWNAVPTTSTPAHYLAVQTYQSDLRFLVDSKRS